MKINIALFAVIVFTISVFASCSKSGGGPTYSMSATVGGSPYVAANCIARPVGTSLLIEGLDISSTIPVAPYIAIVLPNFTDGLDSFLFDSTQHRNFAQYYTTATTYKISENGVVVINAINSTEISGLFQFMCTDSTQVTGGTFVAKRMQ